MHLNPRSDRFRSVVAGGAVTLAMVCLLLAAACTPKSTNSGADPKAPPPPPIVTSSGAPLQRVAVIAIPDKGFNAVRAENVAMEDLTRKGYLLASRSDIDMILREQKLQYNQLMERDFRVKLAELLNVQAMFIIEATSIYRDNNQGKEYYDVRGVAARLIDAVFSPSQIRLETRLGCNFEDWPMAKKLPRERLPGKSYAQGRHSQ